MASLTALKNQLERAKNSAKGMRKKAEATMGTVVYMGETTATAFGFAYARARMGDNEGRLQIQGVDVDLLAGIALHGTGLLLSDKWAPHAAAVGNGALSCYAVNKGTELGLKARSKAKTGTSGRRQIAAPQPRVTDSAFDQSWASVPAQR